MKGKVSFRTADFKKKEVLYIDGNRTEFSYRRDLFFMPWELGTDVIAECEYKYYFKGVMLMETRIKFSNNKNMKNVARKIMMTFYNAMTDKTIFKSMPVETRKTIAWSLKYGYALPNNHLHNFLLPQISCWTELNH